MTARGRRRLPNPASGGWEESRGAAYLAEKELADPE